ncbi:CbiX/SirB N-terminal domain-containing protein [Bacillus cereus]
MLLYFKQKRRLKKVEVCYLAVAEPKFEEKLKEVVEQKRKEHRCTALLVIYRFTYETY